MTRPAVKVTIDTGPGYDPIEMTVAIADQYPTTHVLETVFHAAIAGQVYERPFADHPDIDVDDDGLSFVQSNSVVGCIVDRELIGYRSRAWKKLYNVLSRAFGQGLRTRQHSSGSTGFYIDREHVTMLGFL